MVKRWSVLVVVIYFLTTTLIESADYNTYKRQSITEKTLCHMGSQMSSSLRHIVDQWLVDNAQAIDLATDIPNPLDIDKIRNRYAEVKEVFSSLDKSKYNIVVQLKNTTYFIKLAGIINKTRSIAMSAYKEPIYPWKPLDQIDFSTIDSIVPTYQAISQLAHYLVLREAIKKFNLNHIHAAETFLVHIPWKPFSCNDNNYVIVQRIIPNIEQIAMSESVKEIIATFDAEILRELYTAVTQAMLWDIEHNLFVDRQDYRQLYVLDFEQPNNSKSHIFFYQGSEGNWKHWWDAKEGLEGIARLINAHGSQEQKDLWQQWYNEWMLLQPER